jgi:DNA-binding IclR family transcriptional regulator
MLAGDLAGEGDVIQVVSRAFDVLRCFEGHEARLGNLEISNRCGLPRSTVSRLTHTLTRMGSLFICRATRNIASARVRSR